MQKIQVNSGFTALRRKSILGDEENISRGFISLYFILLMEKKEMRRHSEIPPLPLITGKAVNKEKQGTGRNMKEAPLVT